MYRKFWRYFYILGIKIYRGQKKKDRFLFNLKKFLKLLEFGLLFLSRLFSHLNREREYLSLADEFNPHWVPNASA